MIRPKGGSGTIGARSRRAALRAALVAQLLGLGCATPQGMLAALPEVPSEQAKCKVGASQASPLVTEWPASEKANLEALLRQGGVTVSYAGCTMRVLPRCRLRGRYAWQRTTPASDVLEINNEDELYAKLPLGAASLEGELKRSGKLSVQTVVSGQLRLEESAATNVPNEGECARATHVVGALSVGTFTLTRGAASEAGASAGLTAVGQVGVQTKRSASIVRSAGDPQTCAASTEGEAHPSCRSPIQVFLWPLPGRAAEEGPPGTVRADFVSAGANSRWDVYVDDQVACTTPCSKWVDPNRPVLMRTRDDGFFFMRADKVQVIDLRRPAGGGAVQMRAHPTSYGELATGITFTTLGGTAVIAGITFSSLGCLGDESSGMCTGGLISLGVGALVTAGAIWLIVDAMPRAVLTPIARAARRGPWLARELKIGPGFVTGTF